MPNCERKTNNSNLSVRFKKSLEHFLPREVKTRYEFIDKQMRGFPKSEVFKLLQVEKSAFYRWRKSCKSETDNALARRVEAIFWQHARRYGARRIKAKLIRIGRHRVRRLMRSLDLRAIQPCRFVPRTTDSKHHLGYSPNLLLEMKLPPEKPLQIIVGDITFLPLQNGEWAYLATWTDLFSRRILGWAVRLDMTGELIIEAFLMLLWRVKLPAGCIIHSDRGGQ